MKKISITILTLLVVTTSVFAQKAKTTKKPISKPKVATAIVNSNISTPGVYAQIETSKGNMILQLEYIKTPVTVANFVSLAEGTNAFVKAELKGKPYYNGLNFHRVIADFMIQGGCPNGNGAGDPGYKFKDEFVSDLKHSGPGILSMANSGPTTNGSQFFITHKATPHLDGKHTVFGKIISGQDVVNKIAQNDVINKITIIKNGAEAKAFDGAKVFSNYFGNKAADEAKEELKREEVRKKALEAFQNATTTASGLKYIVEKEGTGIKPTATSKVKMQYAGKLLDGTVFYSTFKNGKPDEFSLTQLIKGFSEGIQLMNVGTKFKVYIPHALAYADRGYPGFIPPKSDLIFEAELLEILQP